MTTQCIDASRRTIIDVYATYRIPAIVIKHQLRVAAVAQILADKIKGVSATEVIRVGLFHDMGNILKMDLSPNAPLRDLLAPNSLEELRQVQADFRTQYGSDEHAASMAIGKEVGLTTSELAMIDNMRYSRTEWVLKEGSIGMKVIKYADLRVAPIGIVSMQDRITEARKRYDGKTYHMNNLHDARTVQETEHMCSVLESIVCECAEINATDITETAAQEYIRALKKFEIQSLSSASKFLFGR